jgi:hypothetical protein
MAAVTGCSADADVLCDITAVLGDKIKRDILYLHIELKDFVWCLEIHGVLLSLPKHGSCHGMFGGCRLIVRYNCRARGQDKKGTPCFFTLN